MKPIGSPSLSGMTLGVMSGYSKYRRAEDLVEYKAKQIDSNNKEATRVYTTNKNALDSSLKQTAQSGISSNVDQQIASNQARGSEEAESGGKESGGSGSSLSKRAVTQQAASNQARLEIMQDRKENATLSRMEQEKIKAENSIMALPDQDVSKLAYLAKAGLSGFRNVSALKYLGKAMDRGMASDRGYFEQFGEQPKYYNSSLFLNKELG